MSDLPMSAAWWRPIKSAPKDRRVLVVSEGGTMHTAEWSKNPISGHEAWRVATINDEGDCLIMQATHWMPLPAAPSD